VRKLVITPDAMAFWRRFPDEWTDVRAVQRQCGYCRELTGRKGVVRTAEGMGNSPSSPRLEAWSICERCLEIQVWIVSYVYESPMPLDLEAILDIWEAHMAATSVIGS
jgi:hypothetical protein